MESYESYKDSGIEWIGEIPAGWGLVPISYCFAEEKRINSTFQSINALKFSAGTIVPKPEKWDIKDIADTYKQYRVVEPETIMVNNLNLNFDLKSQRVGIVEEAGIITSAYIAIVPDKTQVYPKYANYSFKSWDYKKAIHNMGKGLRLTLDWNELKRKIFPLPPLHEQKAIADFLDKKTAAIDALIARTEKSIELAQEYRKSIISEAVTKGLDPTVPMKDRGIEWIGQIPEGWRFTRLRTFASLMRGSGIKREECRSEGRPCVRYGELYTTYSNYITETTSFVEEELATVTPYIKPHELVMAITGETKEDIGPTAVNLSDMPITIGGDTLLIKNHPHNGRFLSYALNSQYVAAQKHVFSHGDIIVHLSTEKIKDLIVILPPLPEQKEIADYLDAKTSQIDSIISAKQEMIDKLKEYRRSLISEAVTGKFKVPGLE